MFSRERTGLPAVIEGSQRPSSSAKEKGSQQPGSSQKQLTHLFFSILFIVYQSILFLINTFTFIYLPCT
jgi:hypothetical protein